MSVSATFVLALSSASSAASAAFLAFSYADRAASWSDFVMREFCLAASKALRASVNLSPAFMACFSVLTARFLTAASDA